MEIPANFIKIFPEYEDVFYGDIENHRKYFLPLCSVNLQFLPQGKDQWLHFVSVKEIYNGRLGENTTSFHTDYTRCDMLGFDIIDGKYKFDAPWEYFTVSTEISPENYHLEYSDEEIQFNFNDAMYQLKKSYYKKFGELYDRDFHRPGLTVDDIRRLERLLKLTADDLRNDAPSDYMSEIIGKKINGVIDEINTGHLPLEECQYTGDNLMEKPVNADGSLFNYVACMEGYHFQENAADQLYLFHNDQVKKAVICFEYT
ncbi:hypothetical protein AB6805_23695 [Chitinophaga sp. RCC_12]|uniref:hypothetical protein n=1 Tax=Chitinophaga sp. RCC_12 TaxID=3239226 RepID=UPI0035265527